MDLLPGPPPAPPTEEAAAASACLLIKTPVSNFSWVLCGGWLDDLDPDLQSDTMKIHLDQWNGREPEIMYNAAQMGRKLSMSINL